MTKQELLQTVRLAMSPQNVTPRPAPRTTRLKSATCINRNIAVGEPVVVYLNESGELLWLGDVPAHSGDFFVDNDSKMYFLSGGKLNVVNGLDGTVYQASADAYSFRVFNGGECCAYKTSSSANSWIVIYPDGTMSGEITFPGTYAPTLGYRNGVLGAAVSQGYYDGAGVFTYSKAGVLTNQLANLYSTSLFRQSPSAVYPIDSETVGVYTNALSGYLGNNANRYNVCNLTDSTNYAPWYDPYSSNDASLLGADPQYGYAVCQDQSAAGTPYAVFKWSLTDPAEGLTEIERYSDEKTYYPQANTYGRLIRQSTVNGETVRDMVDISTMDTIFGDVLTTSTLPQSNVVRENASYLWIEGYGVFQKTRPGWLMYPSSTYPRSAPWGMLGYAVHDVQIGRTGQANIIFE